jgi:hypothetical protein
MTERNNTSGNRQPDTEDEGYKIFVSRIHASFDKDTVQRLFEETLGAESIVEVALVYPKPEDSGEAAAAATDDQALQEHRGFAFVTFVSEEAKQKALDLGTIRGGAKPNSAKKHTMYLRPVVREDEGESEGVDKGICFLWTKLRCPYGGSCKFSHEGEGGCLAKSSEKKVKAKKCFDFRKGKCKLGDACPFSHDFNVQGKESAPDSRSEAERDCINWKTKGKCRKGGKCPYRHEEKVRDAVLNKKRRHDADVEAKNRQPLSIRVFGLCYETTEDDVRGYFEDCGKIVEITFPKFEDSGRSKGYCGVLFQSPKAVAKAVEKDGSELHGRWLSVQGGKMYLKKWEAHEDARKEGIISNDRGDDETVRHSNKDTESDQVGEFGQKVKRRKKHGFASE